MAGTHQPARAIRRRSTSHCSTPAPVAPTVMPPTYPAWMLPRDPLSPPPTAHPTVLASTHQSHQRQPAGISQPRNWRGAAPVISVIRLLLVLLLTRQRG